MEQVATSTQRVSIATDAAAWNAQPTRAPQVATAMLSAEVQAVLEPAGASRAADAERLTRALAHAHYENFSVVSLLLPRHLRQDFCNIYAFCRVADDLGDELADPAESTAALTLLRQQTLACHSGQSERILFVALGETIRRYDIPVAPFLDLIDAFQQDQRECRYETFAQVVDYCRRSADPVGRLVLYLCGYRDEARQRLSDQTCTALQLANFWQDVRRDLLDRDRIYLPAEDMNRFGVSEAGLHDGIERNAGSNAFRQLIEFQVERAAKMFDEGDALLPLLDPAVRAQVALYGKGGRLVLEAIRSQDYDTLARRPVLGRWQKGRLVLSALAARLRTRGVA